MANEIYDSTWWGNTIDTASSIGTSTEMIQGQFNLTKIGDDLVTNGDFATDSNWIKSPSGVTISGGFANFTSGQDTYVYQDIMTIGKQYYIVLEYNISSLTSSAYFGSNGGNGNAIISMAGLSGYGTLSGYITASASRFIVRSSGFNGTITNVSAQQVRTTTVEASKCLADTIHRIGIQDIQN